MNASLEQIKSIRNKLAYDNTNIGNFRKVQKTNDRIIWYKNIQFGFMEE